MSLIHGLSLLDKASHSQDDVVGVDLSSKLEVLRAHLGQRDARGATHGVAAARYFVRLLRLLEKVGHLALQHTQ